MKDELRKLTDATPQTRYSHRLRLFRTRNVLHDRFFGKTKKEIIESTKKKKKIFLKTENRKGQTQNRIRDGKPALHDSLQDDAMVLTSQLSRWHLQPQHFDNLFDFGFVPSRNNA